MALTDVKIRSAKAEIKPYKLADANGLFLLVNANGSKLWRWKYRLEGKENLLALGRYPDVGLAEARKARDAARVLVSQGVSPLRSTNRPSAPSGRLRMPIHSRRLLGSGSVRSALLGVLTTSSR